MCRLFGIQSNQTVDTTYFLARAPQSLLMQSHVDRKRPQGDGWGVGWFEKGKPQVFKSPRPMFREKSAVLKASRQTKGKTVIGHVRWASNPLKLKRQELIGLPHTQPFSHGKWLFAHNGTLFIPKEVAAELGPWKMHLKGKNDSEVLFYWILKHLSGVFGTGYSVSRTANGVRQSLRGLHRIWNRVKKSYPIHKHPYHGLNWVLSDGKTLLAFCYTDPNGFGKSKAFCNSKQPYYHLQRCVTPESVIVASEPIDSLGPWEGFRHGELLIATTKKGKLLSQKVKIR